MNAALIWRRTRPVHAIGRARERRAAGNSSRSELSRGHIRRASRTVAIITRGRRWPWYASMILAGVGIAVAVSAYGGGGAHNQFEETCPQIKALLQARRADAGRRHRIRRQSATGKGRERKT